MLCSLPLWRTDCRGTVASPGSGDEQRDAEEQHCSPLHGRPACQHCEGERAQKPTLEGSSVVCAEHLCVCLHTGLILICPSVPI